MILLFRAVDYGQVECDLFSVGSFLNKYGSRTLDLFPRITVADWLETATPGNYEYFDGMWVVIAPDKD